MLHFTWRVGRWPLALALPALWACTDAPSAPARPSTPEPSAAIADGFAVGDTSDARTRSAGTNGVAGLSLNFPKITYGRFQREGR